MLLIFADECFYHLSGKYNVCGFNLMIYFKQFSYGIRKEQLAVRSVYCDFNRQQQLQNVKS